jgi:hypothetical protein
MVIHIGMGLAAGTSPSGSRALDSSVEILTGETEPSREQNRRRKPRKPRKPPKPPFGGLRNGVTAPAQTGGNWRKPPWPMAEREKILPSIRCERIILRGVLAVQSRES